MHIFIGIEIEMWKPLRKLFNPLNSKMGLNGCFFSCTFSISHPRSKQSGTACDPGVQKTMRSSRWKSGFFFLFVLDDLRTPRRKRRRPFWGTESQAARVLDSAVNTLLFFRDLNKPIRFETLDDSWYLLLMCQVTRKLVWIGLPSVFWWLNFRCEWNLAERCKCFRMPCFPYKY